MLPSTSPNPPRFYVITTVQTSQPHIRHGTRDYPSTFTPCLADKVNRAGKGHIIASAADVRSFLPCRRSRLTRPSMKEQETNRNRSSIVKEADLRCRRARWVLGRLLQIRGKR